MVSFSAFAMETSEAFYESGSDNNNNNNVDHSSNSNNQSEMEILEGFVRSMVEEWHYQARVGPAPYALLVTLYAAMIVVGAAGNLLVIKGHACVETFVNV